ncbi:hypothetical protein H5410_044311 [Solanum commersonii]|uniref:Uncharacterized protein n=2 Tax=Solanum TaxID=4107 RepID=A0A9J5X8Q4_SOLCO|nr:hypothetical protein H5410_044311 [Solanum commersonii]
MASSRNLSLVMLPLLFCRKGILKWAVMIAFFWSTYLPALRKSDMYLGWATCYGNIATGVCSHGMCCCFLFAYLGVASFGVL